jgi:hypothetical protein
MTSQAANSMMHALPDINAEWYVCSSNVIDLSDNQDVILAVKKPAYGLDSRFLAARTFAYFYSFSVNQPTFPRLLEQQHTGFPTPLHTVKPSISIGITQHGIKSRREEHLRVWRSSLDRGGKTS